MTDNIRILYAYPTTRAQRESCFRLWQRSAWKRESYRQFRKRFYRNPVSQWEVDAGHWPRRICQTLTGCAYGMFFGIEHDGYTHT